MSLTLTVKPSIKFNGNNITVPGDKSISHRSIMFGSIAEGTTTVSGFLEGEDSLNTLKAFQQMGVNIKIAEDKTITIQGVGLYGLKKPEGDVYLGNSGTSMRLLTGLFAGQIFDTKLTGDVSLSKRPMKRVTDPLAEMGAVIATADNGRPPLHIMGMNALSAIEYHLPMASAQVKSSVLLAGLYAKGNTVVYEPAPTRDHTERMLKGFGVDVTVDGNRVELGEKRVLTGRDIQVPADISSATFLIIAASISRDADVVIKHVGMNPTRVGVINIIRLMGGDITLVNESEQGGEPIADIHIKSADLKGIQIPEDLVPLAIDEFPAIFIAAACAEGQTVLTGAEELRVKESDRIQVMADGLNTLGVDAKATPDGMIIPGNPNADVFSAGEINSHHDHRIAMAFSLAALRSSQEITVTNAETINTSFPNYVELMSACGLEMEMNKGKE